MAAPPPPPGPNPAPPRTREQLHLEDLQRLNMLHSIWRQRPFDSTRDPLMQIWRNMPVPWRDRNRRGDQDPAVFQPTSDSDLWQGKFDPVRTERAGYFDLDAQAAKAAASGRRLDPTVKRAWDRLNEARDFFDNGGGNRGGGGAAAATPEGAGAGDRKWVYRRTLGFGGNGLVVHYRVEETPEKRQDVAVKIHLRSWSSISLKKEQRIMRKLTHASHIVQEFPRDTIGKRGRDRIPVVWKDYESSEEYDSSGDEDVPIPKPKRRKARKDLTPEELARKQEVWDEAPDLRMVPPPEYDDNARPNDKNFIALEFVENGDLFNLIAKLHSGDIKIPIRVLWSWWLCLIKQCVAMAFYPRKFHPDRMNANGQDLDELIAKDADLWRRKNMVHFDLDPMNIFVAGTVESDPSHTLVPRLKLADFGLAEEVKDQKRDCYYLRLRHRAKFHYYSPEQFGAEWEYIPASRNGSNICDQTVAGNFGSHTNVYSIALTMMCIIMGYFPPQPPLAGYIDYVEKEGDEPVKIRHYGALLLRDTYDWVDEELRNMVIRCLAHEPRHRPDLAELLDHANRNIENAPNEFESDNELREWYRKQVLGA